VLALRNLVTGELTRFPELGAAWRDRGPGRFFPLVAEVLEGLRERGELDVPDIDVAAMQLFSLTLYPHFVFSSFGEKLDADLTERLIVDGVGMFLARYARRGRDGNSPGTRPGLG
jgi:TetR/AcrR family transcriptional regulator, mexJK operon transcriptional repressor